MKLGRLLRLILRLMMMSIVFGLAGCRGEGDASPSVALPPISTPPAPAPTATPMPTPVPTPTATPVLDNVHITVDQFGYRTSDTKVAVIRSPVVGFDTTQTFTPGAVYQVRRASDDGLVFSGSVTSWNGGATQTSSGDVGWWFDFSSLTTPGTYYVLDVSQNKKSATFQISDGVYKEILKAAMRTFYYQRSGFAKTAPYADSCWVDAAAYTGANQDPQARNIMAPDDTSQYRDMSGGWFDAGDTNKYVTFAQKPVHQLLTAYRENPEAFTDDFNIPESGNGLPDVIDEIKWETDWLVKMQNSDGSAALKLGAIEYGPASPPSSDTLTRYYIPSCTSATIAIAGVFAHASHVFSGFPELATQALDLKTRAISAWNNYQGIPVKQTDCDDGTIKSGDADLSAADQETTSVVAAIYLYALTGQSSYHEVIKAKYQQLRPYTDIGFTRYNAHEGEALLFYTTLSHADAAVKSDILNKKLTDVTNDSSSAIYGFRSTSDLYRNHLHDEQYHWGSNGVRAAYGTSNMDVMTYGIPGGDTSSYRLRALETLHYFHGVNPFGTVYLTNMSGYGATRSLNEIYHNWYAPGSIWSHAQTSLCGPAPGYLPGGPNKNALADGVPASLTPPTGQPHQKSYRDWNNGWPENSWVVTEPAIYYQAAYVKLLSNFVE